MVSFKQITQILELMDRLGLNREWVEIPLSAEPPGIVWKLQNGKLKIAFDANQPFEEWLGSLEPKTVSRDAGVAGTRSRSIFLPLAPHGPLREFSHNKEGPSQNLGRAFLTTRS
jgi:hypothetical protein